MGGKRPGKYYFFTIEDGRKLYLMDDLEDCTEDKSQAALFSEKDWYNWGEDGCFEREELPLDQQLKRLDAPMLPGFE